MFVFNKDIKLDDLGDGVSRKILAYSDNIMSVEVHFEKGAIGPMHNHPHEQLTYVLSGSFKFTIGDETKVVNAGDVLYKQPNIMHGCVCLEKGVLLDNFTPMRKDFIQ
ncbi:cupin domain-containing protein [Vibrio porteresiae]|uniref:Cupin domain-containing protein n=1 Tax=Vibrio porteresiae DSM 19223 TaxID=1123496 RepID=A0ABZ0QG21_9VIBR|nr:cupin domain-containing protein [Vibrio porteresiae]WPC75370.1 cupin domain-containing protein [Vibrio porteresiae DSM 19223]